MLSPHDRRRFIKNTAGLSLAAGTVTLGGACTKKQPETRLALQAFSAQQAQTMMRVAEVVLASAPDVTANLIEDIVQSIDGALAMEDPVLRSKIQDAVLFLEWSSQFSLKFKPFSALSITERHEALQRFGDSPLRIKRTVYQAVVGMISFAYADRPESWKHFGYDGPLIDQAAMPSTATTQPVTAGETP